MIHPSSPRLELIRPIVLKSTYPPNVTMSIDWVHPDPPTGLQATSQQTVNRVVLKFTSGTANYGYACVLSYVFRLCSLA